MWLDKQRMRMQRTYGGVASGRIRPLTRLVGCQKTGSDKTWTLDWTGFWTGLDSGLE